MPRERVQRRGQGSAFAFAESGRAHRTAQRAHEPAAFAQIERGEGLGTVGLGFFRRARRERVVAA